ncbi:MAG: N-acetyltransferase [Spirochaetia bacterium]|nr:N-acetyltransferase [Spirochaetota bacterium]MCX8097163.1 N-acetyltransferase [Spirochaetota bacterium]MDW8113085.1 N-acetyltransferase [Spirochaetia bacterium]
MIEVKVCNSVKDFIKIPFYVQGNDPNWVPPLIMDIKKKLDKKRSSFLKHNEAEFFIAYKDGKPVGRIAGIVNNIHNSRYNKTDGFFGFFDSVNDQEVANKLFDTVVSWLKSRGMNTIYGPANYSTNDEWGLLVEGFDSPPFIMMPHNPEYYKTLIENYGFKKAKDLYAWYYDPTLPVDERLSNLMERVLKRGKFKVRYIDMKNLKEEVDKIIDIYHDSWSENFFFIPLTEEEKKEISEFLSSIAYPDMVIIIDTEDGESVAFSVAVHNLNEVLIKYKTPNIGILYIKQLLSLAYRLYIKPRNKFNTARLLLAGVKKKYRGLGLDLVLYMMTYRNANKRGYKYGELSWTLEDNRMINEGIEKMGGRIHKIYRVYYKEI